MQNVAATAMPLPMMAMPQVHTAAPGMPMPQMAGMPQAAMGAPQMAQMMLPNGYAPAVQGAVPVAAMTAATSPVMVTPQMAGVQPMDPMAMHAAYAQGVLGAEAVKPPSTIGTVIKSALAFGGVGAALGAGATLLPFIPGALLTGALIGGVAGLALGAFRGFRAARRAQEEYKMMMQGAPADPGSAQVPVHVADTRPARKSKRKKAASSKKTVTVRKGDTLSEIARRHDVTVSQLHKANRKVIGSDPGRIQVGARLVIPKAN